MPGLVEYQRVDLSPMNRLTALSRRKFLGNVYTALAGMGLIDLLDGRAMAVAAATETSPAVRTGCPGTHRYGPPAGNRS